MISEEQKQQYAMEMYPSKMEERHLRAAYIAGMNKAIEIIRNEDKWKDLYAEGLQVGIEMGKAIATGKPIE